MFLEFAGGVARWLRARPFPKSPFANYSRDTPSCPQGFPELCIGQLGAVKGRIKQDRGAQVCTRYVSTRELVVTEVGLAEVRTAEVCTAEVSSAKTPAAKRR